MDDASDKCGSGIHIKIALPDLRNLVSVDMGALKSSRLCRPGQYSLGGELIVTLSPMTILAQVSKLVVEIITSLRDNRL